jgi:hypothetical protein
MLTYPQEEATTYRRACSHIRNESPATAQQHPGNSLTSRPSPKHFHARILSQTATALAQERSPAPCLQCQPRRCRRIATNTVLLACQTPTKPTRRPCRSRVRRREAAKRSLPRSGPARIQCTCPTQDTTPSTNYRPAHRGQQPCGEYPSIIAESSVLYYIRYPRRDRSFVWPKASLYSLCLFDLHCNTTSFSQTTQKEKTDKMAEQTQLEPVKLISCEGKSHLLLKCGMVAVWLATRKAGTTISDVVFTSCLRNRLDRAAAAAVFPEQPPRQLLCRDS